VVDGSTFAVLPNGNVGVGTQQPVANFDVYTASAPGFGEELAIVRPGAADVGLSFQQNGVDAFGIVERSGAGNGLAFVENYFQTNAGTELMRILGNGNVGIGTAAPDANFAVQGNFSTDNGYIQSDGAGNLTVQSIIFPDMTVLTSTAGLGGGSSQWVGSSGNPIYYIGGNVGIATTTPDELLQVSGLIDFNYNGGTLLGLSATGVHDDAVVGQNAAGDGYDSVVGADAHGSGNDAVLGFDAEGTHGYNALVGSGAGGDYNDSVVGYNATGNANDAVVGESASGSGSDAIVGQGSTGSGTNNAVLGEGASGSGSDAVVGQSAEGNGDSVAVGQASYASANDAVVGYESEGSGNDALLGYNVDPFNGNNAVVGFYANGFGNDAVLGSSATGNGNSVSIGQGAASNWSGFGSQNITIGYGALLANDRGSNQLNIGDIIFGTGVSSGSVPSAAGKVGVGTTQPQATLDVAGFARLATNSGDPAACTGSNAGSIALSLSYNICVCNGSAWIYETANGSGTGVSAGGSCSTNSWQ
jgi:hypothetical protein